MGAAGQQVGVHGGAHGSLGRLHVIQGVGNDGWGQVYPGGAAGPFDFGHAAHDNFVPLGSREEVAQVFAGQGCHAGHGADEEEFGPQGDGNVVRRLGVNVSVAEGRADRFRFCLMGRVAAADAAGDDADDVAGLGDDAGAGAAGLDVGGAGQDDGIRKGVHQRRIGIDAVLEAEDGGVRADHGRHLRHGHDVVVGLGGEQDEIDGSYIIGLVGGGAGDGELAGLGLHDEAVAEDSVQMIAAGDERYVVSGAGEHTAEVAADAAGAHDCHFH